MSIFQSAAHLRCFTHGDDLMIYGICNIIFGSTHVLAQKHKITVK